MKAKKCQTFYMYHNTFFIMDDNKRMYMLKRKGQSRNLTIIKELAMELMQRIDYDPKEFRSQFICEKYAIDKSKIFYFYDVSS